jgi:predicted GIY-YIG superfamily endonuclease
MAWAYILRGDSGRHYIGSTTDLGRRLEDHRRGQTHSTKRLGGNLEIVAAVELAGLLRTVLAKPQQQRMRVYGLSQHDWSAMPH